MDAIGKEAENIQDKLGIFSERAAVSILLCLRRSSVPVCAAGIASMTGLAQSAADYAIKKLLFRKFIKIAEISSNGKRSYALNGDVLGYVKAVVDFQDSLPQQSESIIASMQAESQLKELSGEFSERRINQQLIRLAQAFLSKGDTRGTIILEILRERMG